MLNISKIENPVGKIYDCTSDTDSEYSYLRIENESGDYWIAKVDGEKPDRICYLGTKAILVKVDRAISILDNTNKCLLLWFEKETGIEDIINHPKFNNVLIFIEEGYFLKKLKVDNNSDLILRDRSSDCFSSFDEDEDTPFGANDEDEKVIIEGRFFDSDFLLEDNTISFSWVDEDEKGFQEDVCFDKIISYDLNKLYCSIDSGSSQIRELICEFDIDNFNWLNKAEIEKKINEIKNGEKND